MKLVVGAGERKVPGFVHHDVQALDGIDIVCEFWDLKKHVKKESCQEIHMTHVLEHFPMTDSVRVLSELEKFLAPGGKLYIEVPNFKWHAEEILRNPSNRQIVEYAFGGQLNEWDYHYNGYTTQILKEDLEWAGFRVESMADNSSIECWAIKDD